MKIGTVGSGFIVTTFINAIKDAEGVTCSAVYSRTKERAEEFAREHGVELSFCDRQAFLESKEFDFVYVASPNALHYEWVKDALNAGKNVICEKPFMSTVKEVKELTDLAHEKKLFLFEAVTIPHLPNFKLLKGHINEVGSLKMVQLNFSQYSSRYDAFVSGKKPNVFNPEFSGGALMDINLYNLYFITLLFGKPKNINYFANVKEGIDTSGVLILEYDGFLAEAVGAKDSKSVNSVQIQGDKGYIHVPEESSRCISFTVNTKDGAKVYNEQNKPRSHYYEIMDFAEIYRNGDFAEMDRLLENSLMVVDLMEQARKKAGIIFPADSK